MLLHLGNDHFGTPVDCPILVTVIRDQRLDENPALRKLLATGQDVRLMFWLCLITAAGAVCCLSCTNGCGPNTLWLRPDSKTAFIFRIRR